MKSSVIRDMLCLAVLTGLVSLWGGTAAQAQSQAQLNLHHNPNKQVTFDRTTSYNRAIDVLNNFSQKYTGKPIIDRTNTKGKLGITVPPMQWRDALNLILRKKYLKLVRHRKYLEIVKAKTKNGLNHPVSSRPDTSLNTHSQEVRINAIFFQGDRKALQEVGVNWSTLTNNVPSNVGQYVNQNGRSGGGGSGSGSSQGQLPSKFQAPFVSVNAKGAKSVSQNVFNALVNFGQVFGSGISVQALFSAFQADNLGKILASPSVRVLNGKKGHIQVGEDFSIKQRTFSGNVTDKFFSVGTILNVTPHIITMNDTTFIHLDIDATKSSANPGAVSTVVKKQEASTQALLLNHEATVIAGLYRTQTNKVRRGVPILKNLPPWFFGLRYLFGYNSTTQETKELVILIQASIVPGIPKRMNKRLPGEFDILQHRRNQIQQKINQYNKRVKTVKNPGKGKGAKSSSEDTLGHIPQKIHRKHGTTHDNVKTEHLGENKLPSTQINADEIQASKIPQEKSSNKNITDNSNQSRNHYFVIAGSYKKKRHAEAMKQKLLQDGYDNSRILLKSKDNFYMVAYRGFRQRRTAKQFLKQVKPHQNMGAWIYRAH